MPPNNDTTKGPKKTLKNQSRSTNELRDEEIDDEQKSSDSI